MPPYKKKKVTPATKKKLVIKIKTKTGGKVTEPKKLKFKSSSGPADVLAAPAPPAPTFRTLFYGDNLDVLRNNIAPDSVDLCYIDPPFNSKRNYNQIYNNIGGEVDKAQAQAFLDTWEWDDKAVQGLDEIQTNGGGRFPGKVIELVTGLHRVLGEGNLLAYLVHMSLRLVEIHRVLKKTGSFYLHCDPTASHYLKLVCDAVFCSAGGDFKNEIIWRRAGSHNKVNRFGPIHDVIFFYTKSQDYYFAPQFRPYTKGHVEGYFKKEDATGRYWTNALTGDGTRNGESGEPWRGFNPTSHGRHWAIPGRVAEELNIDPELGTLAKLDAMAEAGSIDLPDEKSNAMPTYRQYLNQSRGIPAQDIWAYQPHTNGVLSGSQECIDEDVRWLGSQSGDERLGYPTQKPEGLLGRIIAASSKEGDVILDAYCGCGTTVAVAEKTKRSWIGIDITYQSIALILKRMEDMFGKEAAERVKLAGIPQDIQSAEALAHKKDDAVRKEFEKWAVLTYSNNRAVINDKKGADSGIDGVIHFYADFSKVTDRAILQVKSGHVGAKDLRDLRGVIEREKAAIGIFITLEEPTGPMGVEAKAAGTYHHKLMNKNYDRLQIVTIRDLIEGRARFELPSGLSGLKSATKVQAGQQGKLI